MHQGLKANAAQVVSLVSRAQNRNESNVLPLNHCSQSLHKALDAALDLSVLETGVSAPLMERKLLACRELTGNLSVIYRREAHGLLVLFRGSAIHGGHEACLASLVLSGPIRRPLAYKCGGYRVLVIPTDTHFVALFDAGYSDD